MVSPPSSSLPRTIAAHAALWGALFFAAGALEAVLQDKVQRPVWLGVDVVLALGLGALAAARRRDLTRRRGLRGGRFLAIVVGLFVISFAIGLDRQRTIPVRIPVEVDAPYPGPADAPNYVRMLREGLGADARYPYSTRPLAPLFAGDANVLPSRDVAALESLNFVALVLTATVLGATLVRLGVGPLLAALSPFFLYFSYLGSYASRNRLLTDPVAYLLHALVLACVVRRRSRPLAWVVMTVGALGSEKLLAWVPVLLVLHVLDRAQGRIDGAALVRRSLQLVPPVLVVVLLHALAGRDDAHRTWWPEKAEALVWTPEPGPIFFPFGVLTALAAVGFTRLPRTMRVVSLLLVPLYLQVVLATDTQRMVAYTFLVWIPAGFLYLERTARTLPWGLGLLPAALLTWMHVGARSSPWVPAVVFATVVLTDLVRRPRRGPEVAA